MANILRGKPQKIKLYGAVREHQNSNSNKIVWSAPVYQYTCLFCGSKNLRSLWCWPPLSVIHTNVYMKLCTCVTFILLYYIYVIFILCYRFYFVCTQGFMMKYICKYIYKFINRLSGEWHIYKQTLWSMDIDMVVNGHIYLQTWWSMDILFYRLAGQWTYL